MKNLLKTLLFLQLSCAVTNAAAQTAEEDDMAASALKNTVTVYHGYMGLQNGITNGPFYIFYSNSILRGMPFLDSTKASSGQVTFNGILYENVTLWYDVVKEKLVTLSPNYNLMHELTNDRVNDFVIWGRHFKHLRHEEVGRQIPVGYYEVLFDGAKSKLYKKHIKTIKDEVWDGKMAKVIEEGQAVYVERNGTFYRITNIPSVLNAYSDHPAEMRDFMRKAGFRNIKNHAASLPAIAAHYETL